MTYPIITAFLLGASLNALFVILFTAWQDRRDEKERSKTFDVEVLP